MNFRNELNELGLDMIRVTSDGYLTSLWHEDEELIRAHPDCIADLVGTAPEDITFETFLWAARAASSCYSTGLAENY